MRVWRCATVSGLVTIVLALSSTAAWAACWEMPIDGGRILTAFGQRYASVTHRGVDISGSPGADVRTPAGGVVTFAGRVPADGGGTCGAVTVELPDGLRVSLLPLDAVFVSAGETVGRGAAVGSLAATGDDSSAEVHLHLGARRGSVYVDPTGWLPGPPVEAGTLVESAPQGGIVADAVSALGAPQVSAGAAASLAVSGGAGVVSPSLAPSPGMAGAGVDVPATGVSVACPAVSALPARPHAAGLPRSAALLPSAGLPAESAIAAAYPARMASRPSPAPWVASIALGIGLAGVGGAAIRERISRSGSVPCPVELRRVRGVG